MGGVYTVLMIFFGSLAYNPLGAIPSQRWKSLTRQSTKLSANHQKSNLVAPGTMQCKLVDWLV